MYSASQKSGIDVEENNLWIFKLLALLILLVQKPKQILSCYCQRDASPLKHLCLKDPYPVIRCNVGDAANMLQYVILCVIKTFAFSIFVSWLWGFLLPTTFVLNISNEFGVSRVDNTKQLIIGVDPGHAINDVVKSWRTTLKICHCIVTTVRVFLIRYVMQQQYVCNNHAC